MTEALNVIDITASPRLDCCVPDFTGKNVVLAQVLSETKQLLGDRARIEVVPRSTPPERVLYYRRMLEALTAANYHLAVKPHGTQLRELGRVADVLASHDGNPGSQPTRELRHLSYYLLGLAPVVALNGRAVFVNRVPSVAEVVEAAENSTSSEG